MPKDDRIRMSLYVTTKVKRRMERLEKLSDSESMTEALRKALALYELLLKSSRDGYQIERSKNGKREVIVLV